MELFDCTSMSCQPARLVITCAGYNDSCALSTVQLTKQAHTMKISQHIGVEFYSLQRWMCEYTS